MCVMAMWHQKRHLTCKNQTSETVKIIPRNTLDRNDPSRSDHKNWRRTVQMQRKRVRQSSLPLGQNVCCPLVSHSEYDDGTDGRMRYIMLSARRGQCY